MSNVHIHSVYKYTHHLWSFLSVFYCEFFVLIVKCAFFYGCVHFFPGSPIISSVRQEQQAMRVSVIKRKVKQSGRLRILFLSLFPYFSLSSLPSSLPPLFPLLPPPSLPPSLQFQVSSLADELSRKLQFLHVSSDGVSDMQILQVEVKVYISPMLPACPIFYFSHVFVSESIVCMYV